MSDGPQWSDGKNARSRRIIPIDASMAKELAAHRRFQAEERIAAGSQWQNNDLVVATRDGRHVSPRNFDQSLERIVTNAGVPRLTSHGLWRYDCMRALLKLAGGDAAEIVIESRERMLRNVG